MANEVRITGNTNILSIYDGTAYRPIACLTSNSFNSSLEVLEKQTKCDPGNIVKSAGAFSYELSVEGEYIDTTSVGGETTKASHDFLFTQQQNKTRREWKLATGLADTAAYYGYCYITDLGLDSPSGEDATFSATLSGDGAVVTADPA